MGPIRQLGERRPRTYGALLVAVGAALLVVLRILAYSMGRISIALVFLAPFVIVFGVQTWVFGTKPSALAKNHQRMIVLLLSCVGGAGLVWKWLATSS